MMFLALRVAPLIAALALTPASAFEPAGRAARLCAPAAEGAPAAQNAPKAKAGAEAEAEANGDLKPVLSTSDLRKLTAIFEDIFEARREGESDLKPRQGLEEFINGFEGKRGETRSFLSLVPDIELALRGATTYKDSGVQKGRVKQEKKTESFGGEIQYAVLAPGRYSSKTAYPLILSIPALGETLDEHLKTHWTDTALRDGAIIAAVGMPSDLEMWDTMGSAENGGGVVRAMHVFREVRNAYNVDIERVFIAGKGDGVAAALTIASLFPDRFAGVIGRNGDASDLSPLNFKNLPVMFAGAGEKASAFAKAAEGMSNAPVAIAPDATDTDVWSWMADRRRAANPSSVALRPTLWQGNKAYWLEVIGVDPNNLRPAEATIDRATNTVTVKADGVLEVRVYFNDRLVDMSAPVRVIVNGVEHEHTIERRLRTMLDLAWQTGDFGRVYTSERVYDVPVVTGGDGS